MKKPKPMSPHLRYMRLETASEVYDMKRRTLRQMCLTDKRLSLHGRPEKAPFRGTAVKVARLWYIPVAELERLFRKGG